jgi:hypothetical protein
MASQPRPKTQEDPRRPKKTQEDPRRPKKTQEDPRRPKKTQEDPRRPKKTQEDPRRSKKIQEAQDKLYIGFKVKYTKCLQPIADMNMYGPHTGLVAAIALGFLFFDKTSELRNGPSG